MGSVVTPVNVALEIKRTPGYADGFYVDYNSVDSVKIKAGSYECNGNSYILLSDRIYTFDTGYSPLTIIYVYIRPSLSTPLNPYFYHTNSEPVWSQSRNGWYNSSGGEEDDRMVGAVLSINGTNDIRYFKAEQVGPRNIRNFGYFADPQIVLALNVTPTGAWVDPPTLNGSDVTPVNGKELRLHMTAEDGASSCSCSVTTAEKAAIDTTWYEGFELTSGYNRIELMTSFFPLDSSRDIKIAGPADDEARLNAILEGYGYHR